MINNFKISTRLNKIASSGIRRLFHEAQTTPDTISLGLGEPESILLPMFSKLLNRL